jgi:hypothetical protein
MIALLGLAIAVLTLISGLFAAVVAIIGVFGFQTIRDEAKKRSEIVASAIAGRIMDDMREQAQATGMTESQVELGRAGQAATRKRKTGRTKATTDKSLNKD